MKLRNPHWLKSLAIHALTLIVATFIGLVIIGNGEAPGLIGTSLWVALISPLVYPLVGPYMVAFLLVTHIRTNDPSKSTHLAGKLRASIR